MINLGEILIILGAVIILFIILMEYFRRKMDAVGVAVSKNVIHSIFQDEEIAASVVEQVVKAISNHFASAKATTKREQKYFDKKLVKGLLSGANPMIVAIMEEIGIMDYVQDKPQLVFYALAQYPQLFQGGMMAPKEGAEMFIKQ